MEFGKKEDRNEAREGRRTSVTKHFGLFPLSPEVRTSESRTKGARVDSFIWKNENNDSLPLASLFYTSYYDTRFFPNL